MVVGGVVSIAVSFALMPFIGIIALGIGSITNGAVEAVVFGSAIRRLCGARLLLQVAAPTFVGVVAGATGVLLDIGMNSTFAGALVGSASAFVLAAAGLAITSRSDLAASITMAREAVGNVRAVPGQ